MQSISVKFCAIAIAIMLVVFVAPGAISTIPSLDHSLIIAMPAAMPAVAEASNQLAYSIEEFCRIHGISRSLYYTLKRAGQGPIEMQLRSRKVISAEAAAAWRREREAAEQPGPVEPTAPARRAFP
jgi:hypothetical protein